MPITVPVRDLKDTAKICKTVREAAGPVTVTRNGYAEMVLMRPEEYDEMRQAAGKQELYQAIAEAEERMDEGRYSDMGEDLARMRERYGL